MKGKMSIKGDLGAQRAAEAPLKPFKGAKTPSNPLKYRKPAIEGGMGPHAV